MTDDLEMVELTDELVETVLLVGPLRDAATNGANGSTAVEHDSWTPINLAALPDKPPIRPTLGDVGIVYPGKRHVFSGPPESAKTLAAYAILIHVVRSDATAILIDFEMGGYDARDRLRELGATNDEISRVRYIEPHEPATEDRVDRLVNLHPQLVVIDAAAGAYDLQGLDDNQRGDVEKLARLYVRSFWRHGIASIFIDHVVKNTEARGKYAIGSERKLGGADVHIGFETISAIQRGKHGLYKLVTHKDRGGYLQRGHLADLELESDPETNAITWAFKPAERDTVEAEYFRPTTLMEKVSAYVELQTEAVSRNAITEAVRGTKSYILDAINALVAEGFLTETDGPRRSRPVHSVRPYRKDDPACNPENPDPTPLVRTGSALVREPDQMTGSTGSPPYRGDTKEPDHPDHPENDERFGSSWLDELAATVDLNQTAGTLEETE